MEKQEPFKEMGCPEILDALSELGRSINIITTYGRNHPAVVKNACSTFSAFESLFKNNEKLTVGSFNGVLTVNDAPIQAQGTLMKSLERKLTRLQITGLRLNRGTSTEEIMELAELLALNEISEFEAEFSQSEFSHVTTEETSYQAVRDGQTVANEGDLNGSGSDGVLVLDEDFQESSERSVHVEQIVAFLKGDLEQDAPDLGDRLSEAATDPDQLGRMIMESVAIRQSAMPLAGETLGDMVIGCLRRTFDGLRKQPVFQNPEGAANLHKALLLLEESVLDKIHALSGEDDPELDRQIVQSVRGMEESLSFELAAQEYVGHRRGLEESCKQMQSFIQSRGADTAEDILEYTNIPSSDWRRIVVESNCCNTADQPVLNGINSLATVFEKLESLMQSKESDRPQMQDLLSEAIGNLDDSISSTRKKLDTLSKQITDEDTGTIGGQGLEMDRNELLAAISEIAQELMQPLTAINASLEMMQGGFVGELTDEQRDMLNLAANSSEHLKFLMNELISIVGCPANKGVDNRFHTTSDEVILMNNNPAA